MDRLRTLYKINDLSSNQKYSEEEKKIRCKLACAYRLIDFQDWSEGIYNHITCRVPEQNDAFLINPFGLFYYEITASRLVKVDLAGKILDRGTTKFGINNRGFVLHSAIHSARPDVHCVLHVHVPEVIAISAVINKYHPISQEGILAGTVAFHNFQGVPADLEERADLANSLGDADACILRNHGLLTCGKTIEEAFYRAMMLLYDIKAQLHLINQPLEKLSLPTRKAINRSVQALALGEKSGASQDESSYTQDIHWPKGDLDWEAYMRALDALMSPSPEVL